MYHLQTYFHFCHLITINSISLRFSIFAVTYACLRSIMGRRNGPSGPVSAVQGANASRRQNADASRQHLEPFAQNYRLDD